MAERTCGGCTACCTTISVSEIDKPAYSPCRQLHAPFSASVGCRIYNRRPFSCSAWSCLWITSPSMSDALRPDRCGVIFDPMLDVAAIDGVTKVAAQVWASAGHEEDFLRNEGIQAAIEAMLEGQADIVLWRLPPKDGRPQSRAIIRDPETGDFTASHIHEPTENALGGHEARLRKLMEMTGT